MKTRTLPMAVAFSLGAHGLALALMVMANANGFKSQETIENVPFITASLIYAMNGRSDQKTQAPLYPIKDRTARIVNNPIEPVPLIVQANKTESRTSAPGEIRKEQAGDREADAPISLHLPVLSGMDTKEIASFGKTYGGDPDVAQGSGSPRAESMQMALPRYLHASRPAYPLMARIRGYEGMVLLAVEVLMDGRAGEVRIKKSSGYALLDQSALNAIRAWRFEPARQKDMPLAMTVDIPIRFSLTESD